MGDKETWSTSWKGPPDGDHSSKNPPLGGNRQDPRSLADTGMVSQWEKNKRGIPPWPKRSCLREKLGRWTFLFPGCESSLAKTPKPLNGTKSSGLLVWPGIINSNKLALLLISPNGDRAPSAPQGQDEK